MDNRQFKDLSDALGKISEDKNTAQQKATELMSGLNTEQNSELQKILADKEKINEILSSPVAQKLMKKFNGNANGQHK